MNKNKIFIILVVIIIIGVGAWFQYQNSNKPVSGQFSLTDTSSKYTLEKSGSRFVLTYEKTGAYPETIMVSSNTTVDLESFVGKNILITGEFIEESIQVQCIQAPCPPVATAVLKINSVKEK